MVRAFMTYSFQYAGSILDNVCCLQPRCDSFIYFAYIQNPVSHYSHILFLLLLLFEPYLQPFLLPRLLQQPFQP